jgi:putative membrane protein
MAQILLAVTCGLLAISLVGGQFPREQSLQHIPTLVAIAALFVAARKQWLSPGAIACLIAFLWLHILGARFIYSYVPYDDWLTGLGVGSTREWFGWQRNHYDRLVHLLFGALIVPPAVEVAERYGRMSRPWAVAFAICIVAALSAVYEVAEWIIAIVLSPAQAEAYNGQQGDMWDAQKDMALAIVGSLPAAVMLLVRNPSKRNENP